MKHDLELVPLKHLQSVLPWSYQTLKNLRCRKNPDDRKKIAWIKKAENNQLMASVPELKHLLLVIGSVNVAYGVEVRVEQFAKHGPLFRDRDLYCPFSAPRCRAMTCDRCLSRFSHYKETYTLEPM